MAARTIAIYGKGGIGKSFITTNLSATMCKLDQRVLQLGCDPKHDSTTSLFGGVSLPTVTEVFAKKNLQHSHIQIEDVVFKRRLNGFERDIFGIELGGPEVGRGCGGRGIISGFEILEKLGLFKWDLDVILMDFLGDVVCGGFATPLSRSLCEEVILVVSNDRQSIFAANNICLANNYFNAAGSNSKLLGLIINRDDGSGIAERYAEAAGINVLMKLPYNSEARDKADSFDLAMRLPEIQKPFDELGKSLLNGELQYCSPKGLSYEEFMSLFGEISASRPQAASFSDLHLVTKPEIDIDRLGSETIQNLSTIQSPEPKTANGEALPKQEEFDVEDRQNAPNKNTATPKILSEQEKLLHCIQQLPPLECDLISLHDIDKKSVEEIAIIKQLEHTEIRATLNKARQSLKRLFFDMD